MRERKNVAVSQTAREHVGRHDEWLIAACTEQRKEQCGRVPQHQLRVAHRRKTSPDTCVPQHTWCGKVRQEVDDSITRREQTIRKEDWREEECIQQCVGDQDYKYVLKR